MKYFDHDTDASSRELMDLRFECGGAAVDAYWFIIEAICREERPFECFACPAETEAEPNGNPTANPTETQSVSESEPSGFARVNPTVKRSVIVQLDTDVDNFLTWVEKMVSMGLLTYVYARTEGIEYPCALMSARAQKTIERYHARAAVNRENGAKGGRPKKSAKTQSKPSRKASAKRSESQRKPNGFSEKTQSVLREEKRREGTGPQYKGGQIPSGNHSARRGGKAENARFACPECGDKLYLNNQSGRFSCEGCGCLFDESELA